MGKTNWTGAKYRDSSWTKKPSLLMCIRSSCEITASHAVCWVCSYNHSRCEPALTGFCSVSTADTPKYIMSMLAKRQMPPHPSTHPHQPHLKHICFSSTDCWVSTTFASASFQEWSKQDRNTPHLCVTHVAGQFWKELRIRLHRCPSFLGMEIIFSLFKALLKFCSTPQ